MAAEKERMDEDAILHAPIAQIGAGPHFENMGNLVSEGNNGLL